MLRIREDRQAVARRIEIARVAVGGILSLLAVAYWSIQIVARRVLLLAVGEQSDPRGQDHRSPRLRPGPQRRRPRRERAGLHAPPLPPRGERHRRLDRLHRGPAGLDREQVRSRVERGRATRSSCRFRSPRTSASRRSPPSRRVPPSIPSSPSRFRSGASTSMASPRPTRSATSRRRRPTRSRTPATPTASATGSGRRASRAPYERLLAGVSGERRVIVDSHGREVAEEARLEAIPGQNLFLTLDSKLQGIAEEYFRSRVGSVVALDPRTGEILALVSSPSYDPELVHASRHYGGVERPDRRTRTGPSRTAPIQNTLFARLGHQAVPGLRGAGQRPRRSGGQASSVRATRRTTAASSTATRRAATASSTCATRSRCRAMFTSTTWAGGWAWTASTRS